jgi:hypothetical protein
LDVGDWWKGPQVSNVTAARTIKKRRNLTAAQYEFLRNQHRMFSLISASGFN